MRITEKKENGFYELKEGEEIYGEENGIRLVQIVGQLEDIKDELGISLKVLFKCFKSTKFYIRNLFGEIIEVESDIVRFDIGHGYVYFGADYCPLSDYGKTWALTKEELE